MSVIRTKREAARLKMEQVARAVNMSVFALGRIERGEQALKLQDALALAKFFHCPVEAFASETVPEQEPTPA